jgi:2-polyprenyl-3-methyl-5-hydroxy-6-metoxy-1,4-benzoquinol methylase
MNNKLDGHVEAYEGRSIYDFDNSILLNWYPERVIAATSGAQSLLELGLGHGITARQFLPHFKRYLVLEGSSAVIANFNKRFPECPVEIIETFFEEFDTKEQFDVIVLGFVLEHVDDPQQILKHFRSFLKPGGDMFVAVPNAEVLNRRLGHHAGLLPDMHELSENDLIQGHKRYYSVASFTEELETAGYAIKRMEGVYLKPLTTSQMLSLNLSPAIINAMCEVGVDYPELSCGLLAHVRSTSAVAPPHP